MKHHTRTTAALALLLIFAAARPPALVAAEELTVIGADRMNLMVLEDEVPLFRIDATIRGPGWQNRRPGETTSLPTVEDGDTRVLQDELAFYSRGAKTPLPGVTDLRMEASQQDSRTIEIRYALTPKTEAVVFGVPEGRDEARIGIGPLIAGQPYFEGGEVVFEMADGATRTLPLPPTSWSSNEVVSATLKTADGETTRLVFDPPAFIHCDIGEIRMMMGGNQPVGKGDTLTATVSMTLPHETDFEPSNRLVDTSDWLVYEHKNDFSTGSVIGMENWIERPAGKHGWMKVDGDRLVFEDGTPAKLYGTGISWRRIVMPRETAEQWADKFAKYGVNVVRLIPMLGDGHQGLMTPEDHLEFVPEKIDQFDGLHAAMRERGVYTGWSPQYHMYVTPADKDRVIDYDELIQGAPRGDTTYNVFNIAPDLQDLMIRRTLKLLTHRNKHTGLRYADDPAIPWIELRNENDIFFNFDNFGEVEKNFPGYFKRFKERFCDYLEDKYKTQEALEKAWGASYPESGTLAGRDIRPNYKHWEMRNGTANPHQADTMHFMYLEQKGFYDRYIKAIREAGYGGALDGSCWQASSWLGHLWNVLSDSEVGIVDRHNYNTTLLHEPGAGLMTVAFQQVKGSPFNFSEWGGGPIAVPTVAVYGMGLLGWDISNQYASGIPDILNRRNRNINSNADDFIQISQFPALSRMIYRGDVREGEAVATRRIGIEGLKAGDVGINETFTLLGGANNKTFSSVIPNAAIAAGKVLLEYIDGPVPEDPVVEDFSKYIDEEKKIVRASNKQLEWHYGGRGYYTVDTPGTQAVIGHIRGKTIDLENLTLATPQETELKFYLSALEKDESIATAKRLLITALGRDANTGMLIDEFEDTDSWMTEGGEPLLIEPIEATVTLKGLKVKSVLPLDHGGRMREGAKSLKIKTSGRDSTFAIDGKGSKTMYYLVEVE